LFLVTFSREIGDFKLRLFTTPEPAATARDTSASRDQAPPPESPRLVTSAVATQVRQIAFTHLGPRRDPRRD